MSEISDMGYMKGATTKVCINCQDDLLDMWHKVESRHTVSREFVYIPQGESLIEIVRGFEDCWGFLQAAGDVDGSHIPITKPLESASDYYNRKDFCLNNTSRAC